MVTMAEMESMRIYVEGGVSYTNPGATLDADSGFGIYGHVGFEWFMNKAWSKCCSAFVELGTTGKGDNATNMVGNPEFGHGFETTVGLRYFFGE
jgi:hypothetical protein